MGKVILRHPAQDEPVIWHCGRCDWTYPDSGLLLEVKTHDGFQAIKQIAEDYFKIHADKKHRGLEVQM